MSYELIPTKKQKKHFTVQETVIEKRPPSAILVDVDRMSNEEFKKYLGQLLIQQGYTVQVVSTTEDFGVDIIAERKGTKHAIRTTKTSDVVQRSGVSEVVAGKDYYKCNSAMIITNMYFTDSAKTFARSVGCKLIDRDGIAKWLGMLPVEHQLVPAKKKGRGCAGCFSRLLGLLILLLIVVILAAAGLIFPKLDYGNEPITVEGVSTAAAETMAELQVTAEAFSADGLDRFMPSNDANMGQDEGGDTPATDSSEPTSTPMPADTPLPTTVPPTPLPPTAPPPTSVPAATDEPTVTATPTPQPTATPLPTATERPGQIIVPTETAIPSLVTPIVAPSVTVSPLSEGSSSLALSRLTIGLAIGDMIQYADVQDATIVQSGNLLSLALMVDEGTSETRAKRLGTNFVRTAKSFATLQPLPIDEVGTGEYRYLVTVVTPDQSVIAEGAKAPESADIEWTSLQTIAPEGLGNVPIIAPTINDTRLFLNANVVDTGGQSVRLRIGPGTDYPIADVAFIGQNLKLVGRNEANDWYQLAEGPWIAAFLVVGDTETFVTLPIVEVEAIKIEPVEIVPDLSGS